MNNILHILFGVFISTIVLASCSRDEDLSGSGETPEVEYASNPIEAYGDLEVNNTHMVSVSTGDTVQLRGMSLFWSQWEPAYWNSNVVDWLADDWESSIIRASMGVEDNGGYITNKEREQAKVEAVVDAAIAKGIYVIIDWHSHNAENYTDDAIDFFQDMATKYGDKPNVIYEIYNEPINSNWNTQIKPYAQEVVDSIRVIDPDNIIVIGTRSWSQKLDEVIGNEVLGDNLMYTLHFYTSEAWHSNLPSVASNALRNGIPVFVTEWGVSEASGDGNFNVDWTDDYIEFMDENKLSWCNWSVTDKNETSAALKSGAAANGGWDPETDLTASGTYIRNLLKSYEGYSKIIVE